MLIVEKERIEEELRNWDPLCLFDKKKGRKKNKKENEEKKIMILGKDNNKREVILNTDDNYDKETERIYLRYIKYEGELSIQNFASVIYSTLYFLRGEDFFKNINNSLSQCLKVAKLIAIDTGNKNEFNYEEEKSEEEEIDEQN